MKGNRIFGSISVVFVMTLVSKFLGFIREQCMAAYFGAGVETDAYFVATAVPLILFTAFGKALQSAYMPVYGTLLAREERENSHLLFNSLLGFLTLGLVVSAVIAILLAPMIVKIMAPGFEGVQQSLATKLTRIVIPSIIFLSWSSILSGALHTHKMFLGPALIGLPYNFILIGAIVLSEYLGGIYGVAVALVLACFCQFLIQTPFFRKTGLRFRFSFKPNPLLKNVFRLMLPMILGTLAAEMNILVDRFLGSSLPTGSISALSYSFRLVTFCVAVFAMPISTVVYPHLTTNIALGDRFSKYKSILETAIKTISFIIIPISIALAVLRVPAVSLVYERGSFDSYSTQMTAQILLFYCLGIPALSLKPLIDRTFYSLRDTKTPMRITIGSVILNLVLSVIFVRFMGAGGLALGTSLANWISLFIHLIVLQLKFKVELIPVGKTLAFMGRVVFISAIAGSMGHFTMNRLNSVLTYSSTHMRHIITSILSLGVIILVFALLCMLFFRKEVKQILSSLSSIIRGKGRKNGQR